MASKETDCESCDKEYAKWTCDTCNTLMCEKCKINHKESKMTANHSISMKDQEDNCETHPGEVVQMFCDKCKVLVCFDCISGSHSEHRFLKISQVYESKRTELIEIVEKYNKTQAQDMELKRSVEQNKEEYYTSIDKSIGDIKEENRKLKVKIDSITDKLVNTLHKKKQEVQPIFEQRIGAIENRLTTVNSEIEIAKRHIESRNKIAVIKSVSKLKKFPPLSKQQNLLPPVYIPGKYEQKDIEPFLGAIDDEDEKASDYLVMPERKYKVIIMSKFEQPDEIKSFRIAATMNGYAWIYNQQNKLFLVDTKGKVSKTIDLTKTFFSFAVSTSNELFVSTQTNVLRYDQDGKVKDSYKFTWKCSEHYYISISNIGYILIFFYDGGYFSYLWFNEKIDALKTITQLANIDTKPFFPNPTFVLKDDHDICILISGELEVFSTNLEHKFTYTGNNNRMIKPFYQCLESDMPGNILLGDSKNSTIEIIDSTGKFIQFLMGKSDGLVNPMAISMKVNGTLWVYNQGNGKVFVLEYAMVNKEEQATGKDTEMRDKKMTGVGKSKKSK